MQAFIVAGCKGMDDWQTHVGGSTTTRTFRPWNDDIKQLGVGCGEIESAIELQWVARPKVHVSLLHERCLCVCSDGSRIVD
mgnify:CR=1 FL=1